MPQTEMAMLTRSPEMREAARFLHYLRQQRQYSYYRDNGSAELRRWLEAFDDSGRAATIAEDIAGLEISTCDECGEQHWPWSFNGYVPGVQQELCRVCVDSLYWCDDCGEFDREPHDHTPDPAEACQAPHRSFRFPVIGQPDNSVRNDERFPVEMAGGTLSDPGLRAVGSWLSEHTEYGSRAWDIIRSDSFSPEWTTKEGNFPKRVAKLYLKAGFKLTSEQVAEIGNIARRHTSQQGTYGVEFTRDLNLPAEEFVHGGSCWWGSEDHSRCILKQCGGLGIRTWTAGENRRRNPAYCACDICQGARFPAPEFLTVPSNKLMGRAWIVPLDSGLDLSHDAMHARAFVVFNAYGLDGYDFARMVAQITGKSYRRIDFTLGNAYVNGEKGFLIADADTCQRNDSLYFAVRRGCDCGY